MAAEYLLRLMVLNSKPRTETPGAFFVFADEARGLAQEVRDGSQQEQNDYRVPTRRRWRQRPAARGLQPETSRARSQTEKP